MGERQPWSTRDQTLQFQLEMLNGPKHQLPAKTVAKQEGRISGEMVNNACDVGRQFLIVSDENRFSVAPAMPSQIKRNRSKTCCREKASHMHITSRVFAEAVHKKHVRGRTIPGIPVAGKYREALARPHRAS